MSLLFVENVVMAKPVESKFHGYVEKCSLGVLAIELSEAGIKLNGEPINPNAKMAEKILIKLGYVLVQ